MKANEKTIGKKNSIPARTENSTETASVIKTAAVSHMKTEHKAAKRIAIFVFFPAVLRKRKILTSIIKRTAATAYITAYSLKFFTLLNRKDIRNKIRKPAENSTRLPFPLAGYNGKRPNVTVVIPIIRSFFIVHVFLREKSKNTPFFHICGNV